MRRPGPGSAWLGLAVALVATPRFAVAQPQDPYDEPTPPAKPAPAKPPPDDLRLQDVAPIDAPERPPRDTDDVVPLGPTVPPSAPVRPPRVPAPGSELAAPHTPMRVRYALEGIEIRGNTRTADRVILRYVKFRGGDVLDVEDPEIELTK